MRAERGPSPHRIPRGEARAGCYAKLGQVADNRLETLQTLGDETGLRQGFGANLWFQIRRKCVPSTRDFENKNSFDLENEIYLPFGG